MLCNLWHVCIYLAAWWYIEYCMALVAVLDCGKFNTLRLRQNGWHLPEDISKWIFLNEDVSILIKISLGFVPKGPINNISAMVKIIVWRHQMTSHYFNQLWLSNLHIYVSLSLNELMFQEWSHTNFVLNHCLYLFRLNITMQRFKIPHVIVLAI